MARAAKQIVRTHPMVILYVAGDVPSSMVARHNLDAVLDSIGKVDRHSVAIIDVLQRPQAALEAGLIATPSLLVRTNGLNQWFLGDLRHTDSLKGWLESLPALRIGLV